MKNPKRILIEIRVERNKGMFPPAETQLYANHYGWSDVNPYEVVEVRTSNKLIVRPMQAELKERPQVLGIGGFSATYDNTTQKWDITPCPEAQTIAIRKHKDGKWYGRGKQRFGISLKPHKYYDYNF